MGTTESQAKEAIELDGKARDERCPSVEVISKNTTQIGGVTVNFTVGRIRPRGHR